MSISRTFLCGVLLAGISGGAARAGYVAFGNLDNGGGNYLRVASPPAGAGPLAESFTAGVGTINDVTLGLFNGGDTRSVVVTLNRDLSHSPGSIVATLGTVLDTSIGVAVGSVYTFSGLNIALTAGSTYWIEVKDTTAPNLSKTHVRWQTAQDATGTGVAGQFVFANGASGPVSVTNPLLMQVDAPEPATLALLGIGIAGLGWVRSRRKGVASKA